MKNNLRKINNLIGFHWVFIKNNPLLWILASIGCLTQTILFVFFEIFKLQLVDYALLLFLMPNIIYSIFIIVINYLLIQVNKDNSIDDRLLCSEFNKFQIKLARFILVWIFLAGMIIISDLFLFYFVIRNQIMFGIATFISNTFITPFILLFISVIFSYLAINLSKGGYVLLTILISFVSFGLSLITRVFIPKPEIDSNNYYKLIQKDSQYLVEKAKTNINLNQFISSNTFIPSEWFYSFYSLAFGITNKNSNSDFSIRMNKLKLSNYDDVLNSDMPIMIREQDFNFLSLSTEEYVELICSNIEKIINKYDLYQNTNLLKQVIENISTNFEWSYINNPTIINILLDVTGINTEYNQLFYLIKYNKTLNLNLNVFINGIKNRFNQDISNLFKTLIESDNTFFNLFKANNKFNSLNIYPNEYIVDEAKPIVLEDENFIKQKLIIFEGNFIYYLKTSWSYAEVDISILQKIDPKIKDEETYINYINSLSKTYKSSSQFLNRLKNEIPNIINYSLSNNYINLDSINNLYKFISYSNINYSEIFMSLISFINVVNSVLFFINLKEKKND